MSVEEKENFVCDICGRIFTSKRGLGNHVSWCLGGRKKSERKPHSQETIRKISESHKGVKLSKEHIESLRKAHLLPRKIRICELPECNNTFECLPKSRKRYCSPYCARQENKVDREIRYCKNCGKGMECRVTSSRTCCSVDCSNAYRRQFIDYYSPERNKKISNSVSLQYINGTRQTKNGYDEGWVFLESIQKKVYCRSSYEKKFLKILDDSSVELVDLQSEALRIPYRDIDGIDRFYIPDFLIETLDSSKYIIEVKPDYKLEDPNVKKKFEAAMKYSYTNGFIFIVITEKSICFSNNGSTTGFLQEIEEATAAILNRMMIQSEPYGNIRRQGEITCPPTIVG